MKIQWNGSGHTLVRIKAGAEKEVVKTGDVLEVSDEKGKDLLRYSKDFKVVTADVKEDQVEKGALKDFKKKFSACETLEDFQALKKEMEAEKSTETETKNEKKEAKDKASKKVKKETVESTKEAKDKE